MDYKQRNPNITFWPDCMMSSACEPFPYNEPSYVSLLEIDAPDFSTQFLLLPFDMNGSERQFISYLIEAPGDCPMRRKFEFGEISWHEFWYHRGWLIEYQVDLDANGAKVRYVHPSQVIEGLRFYLTEDKFDFPMLLKLKALEFLKAFGDRLGGFDMEKITKELTEFHLKYPEIVQRNRNDSKAA